jgi:hypothetical protein
MSQTGSSFIAWLLFNERAPREINAISAHCAREINAGVDNTCSAMSACVGLAICFFCIPLVMLIHNLRLINYFML